MRRLWIAALLVGCLATSGRAGEEPPRDDPLTTAAARLTAASIEDLHRAMMSGDVVVRRAAVTVAGRRTTESAALVDELVAATGDDDAAVRLAATRALGATGRIEAACVQRLARLAEHATNPMQRRAAAAALVRISTELDASRALLLDPSGRTLVFGGLSELGADGVAALVKLAESSEWRTRAASASALAAAEPSSAAVHEAISGLLRDESAAVRAAAIAALPRILGSALITTADVERAFAEGEGTEGRLLLLVALAEPGPQGSETADQVRETALRLAAKSGDRRERLAAVRMAYASGLHSDEGLSTLAGLAAESGWTLPAEAAATLWHAAQAAALSDRVAGELVALTRHEHGEVASAAAAALAVGGHHDDALAVPMVRLLRGRTWRPWRDALMCSPPVQVRRRGLVGPSPPLPAPAGIACDDLVAPLRTCGAAGIAALRPLLGDEFSATRCSAAWMVAELVGDEDVRGELLAPLLSDVVPSVRIVVALRLVGAEAQRDRSVRMLTAALLADDLDDPVIYSDFEGGRHRGSPLVWDDEMIAAAAASPAAAVRAFVDIRAGSISPQLSWSSLPGERHVRPRLQSLGAAAHTCLLDEFLEGDERRRLAVVIGFEALGSVTPDVRKRLESLRDDPELGLDARTILERTVD